MGRIKNACWEWGMQAKHGKIQDTSDFEFNLDDCLETIEKEEQKKD